MFLHLTFFIGLLKPTKCFRETPQHFLQRMGTQAFSIHLKEMQKIFQCRAVFEGQRTIHIGFTGCHFRAECEFAVKALVM